MDPFWLERTVREFVFTYGYFPPKRFIRERIEADKKLGIL